LAALVRSIVRATKFENIPVRANRNAVPTCRLPRHWRLSLFLDRKQARRQV